jgi:hypothetical protein
MLTSLDSTIVQPLITFHYYTNRSLRVVLYLTSDTRKLIAALNAKFA